MREASLAISRWRAPTRRPVSAGLVLAAVLVCSPILGTGPPSKAHAASRWTTALDCQGAQWTEGQIEVDTPGCETVFALEYAENFSSWDPSESYNFSFSIVDVAEVDSGGHLVRIANAFGPSAGASWVAPGQGEVTETVNETINVTSAMGNWTPTDAWGFWGNNWTEGTTPVGSTALAVVFHLRNESASNGAPANASYQVKFDVKVSGWPWASTTDRLGVVLASLGAGGSHFSYAAVNRTLEESWNTTNRTFVRLGFGAAATAGYANGSSAASAVGVEAHLFYAASPDRESVALLTFDGVEGNYSSIDYDPLVTFVPGLAVPSNPGSGWPGGWPLPVLAGGIAFAGIGAVVASVWVRGRRNRREGNRILREIDRVLGDEPQTPVSRP